MTRCTKLLQKEPSMPQLVTSVEGVVIHRIYLTKDRTILGRKPNCDVVLMDLAVSGEHCAFELEGLSDVVVQDLRSTNGTYVNDRMVKRHTLVDGDVMMIGRFRVEYLRANELTDEGRTIAESRTAAMPLDGNMHHTGGLQAKLKVLAGSSAGLELPVAKAVSTFGKRGIALVAIAHRRSGYFISLIETTHQVPTLNGKPIAQDPALLSPGDVIELAGSTLEFLFD
jgi:pSer/pThr/pTyr-binding forkhead associated (FHA) protein